MWLSGRIHSQPPRIFRCAFEGTASIIDKEGNAYEGSFANWTKHGKGTLIKRSREKYSGQWINGYQHGYGVLVYPDGSRFEGMFENGEQTGEGTTYDPSPNTDKDPIFEFDKDTSRRPPMVLGVYDSLKAPRNERTAAPKEKSDESERLTDLDMMLMNNDHTPLELQTNVEKKAAKVRNNLNRKAARRRKTSTLLLALKGLIVYFDKVGCLI